MRTDVSPCAPTCAARSCCRLRVCVGCTVSSRPSRLPDGLGTLQDWTERLHLRDGRWHGRAQIKVSWPPLESTISAWSWRCSKCSNDVRHDFARRTRSLRGVRCAGWILRVLRGPQRMNRTLWRHLAIVLRRQMLARINGKRSLLVTIGS